MSLTRFWWTRSPRKFTSACNMFQTRTIVRNIELSDNTRQENGLLITIRTSHSLWPWSPSWLRVFTATVSPVPGFTGAVPFSSIQPLKTQPNPPSPRKLSGRKFLVANLSSLKENFRSLEAILSSSSSLVVEELLSALLVVVEEITGAVRWPLLVSLVDLLSANKKQKDTQKVLEQAIKFKITSCGIGKEYMWK